MAGAANAVGGRAVGSAGTEQTLRNGGLGIAICPKIYLLQELVTPNRYYGGMTRTVLRGSKPELWPWFDMLGFNVFLFDWLSLLTGGPVLRECLDVGRRLTIGLRDSEPFSFTKIPLAYTWVFPCWPWD